MTDRNSLLLIRKATQHDIPVIRNIAHETWPVAYKTILTPEALQYMLTYFYSEDALLQQMNNEQHFFIAELDNAPIGFGAVSKHDASTFKLNKLYVLPNIQKSGAGTELLHHAIRLTSEEGATRLILNVNRFNPARTFYEKHGFKIISEEDVELGNGIVQEDYVMSLNIEDYRH